jgi:hypothetical protein
MFVIDSESWISTNQPLPSIANLEILRPPCFLNIGNPNTFLKLVAVEVGCLWIVIGLSWPSPWKKKNKLAGIYYKAAAFCDCDIED